MGYYYASTLFCRKRPVILTIRHPGGCESERAYIINWLFSEIYGLEAILREDRNTPYQVIECSGSNQKLAIPDAFFVTAKSRWLRDDMEPVIRLAGARETPPMLCWGSPVRHANESNTRWLDFDLIGALFYLVSGYGEAVSVTRDQHGRVPSWASILAKSSLLERPLGNEYIEYLWNVMKELWPGLKRPRRHFRFLVSHDIDLPAKFWTPNFSAAIRTLTGNLLSRRPRLVRSFRDLTGRLRFRHMCDYDPWDNVSWIMDESEANGLTSAFFYIPIDTCSRYDPGMPINHPLVQRQWLEIAKRGHEIGVHPGYNAFGSGISEAASLIRRQLGTLGIKQHAFGGRHHFLRWCPLLSPAAWQKAGVAYDSTLGFADSAGFRRGICYEFPLYDLRRRQALSVRERPLIVMDCTIIDRRYQNLGTGAAAFDYIKALKEKCRQYCGDFTLLWHNNRLEQPEERELYRAILRA